MKPKLKLAEPRATLAKARTFHRIANPDHEARCIVAIRRRVHPAWSQHAVSFRVTEPRRLRSVKA